MSDGLGLIPLIFEGALIIGLTNAMFNDGRSDHRTGYWGPEWEHHRGLFEIF